MLDTPFGKVEVKINDVIVDCSFNKLCDSYIGNSGDILFKVSGRYKCKIDTTSFSTPFYVTCEFIEQPKYNDINTEPGEDLILKSWYKDSFKISMGTYDDENNDKGFYVEYLDYGLKIVATKKYIINELVFCIAWLNMSDIEREDIYTWFAADPSYN